MLLLAATASKFHKLPSEMLGIQDDGIALAFDLECGAELLRWEQEQEATRLGAMGMGVTAQAFGSTTQPTTGIVDRSKAVRLDA